MCTRNHQKDFTQDKFPSTARLSGCHTYFMGFCFCLVVLSNFCWPNPPVDSALCIYFPPASNFYKQTPAVAPQLCRPSGVCFLLRCGRQAWGLWDRIFCKHTVIKPKLTVSEGKSLGECDNHLKDHGLMQTKCLADAVSLLIFCHHPITLRLHLPPGIQAVIHIAQTRMF